MARAIVTEDQGQDYATQVRNLLTALLPTEPENTSDPVMQEIVQCHREATDLASRLTRQGVSDGDILDELRAWASTRPLPVLDARKRSMSVKVDSPSTVADILERSGQ
jgi:hypothetical protein